VVRWIFFNLEQKKPQTAMTKVVQGAKDTGYTLIIIASLGGVALCAYAVWRMLIGSDSPYHLYDRAADDISKDPIVCSTACWTVDRCDTQPHAIVQQVQKYLGSNITSFGRRTVGGRHADLPHAKYTNDRGQKCMRLAFGVKGEQRQGTAFAEFVQVDKEYVDTHTQTQRERDWVV
jgi:hypothetical protein